MSRALHVVAASARPTANGYVLRFDGVEDAIVEVATFLADEFQCCSFAEFSAPVAPPYEETRLRISGPEGTKALFEDGFVDRLKTADDR